MTTTNERFMQRMAQERGNALGQPITGKTMTSDPDEGKRAALREIAAQLPREDEWTSSADFMEWVAHVLDRNGIERPDHYPAGS